MRLSLKFVMISFLAMVVGLPMAHAKTLKKAFIIEPGLFTENPVVVVNGKAVDAEGWSPLLFDLEDAVQDNRVAADLAATHEAYGRASGIVLWAGMGAAATYAVITPRDRMSSAIFWGTFGGSIVASLGLEKIAKIYLYRALRAYNAPDNNNTAPKLSTNKLDGIKLSVQPLQNGGALAFALDF